MEDNLKNEQAEKTRYTDEELAEFKKIIIDIDRRAHV